MAFAAAVVTVFGTPVNLKTTLKTSGVYEKAVDGVIDQAKKDQGEGSAVSDVPIDDPAIQAAIKAALPADFVEQTSSQAIDGLFGWLQGKTQSPQFSIDLNTAKQKLATGVADVAYARASTLPVCTLQQLQTINPSDVDIFSLPCLPPNVNLQAERDKLANKIASGNEFLEDTTISSEDLPKDNGQTAFDKASVVPTVYQWLVRLPWILGGVAVLAAAVLVFLHDERRRGILLVGRALLVLGLVLIAIAALANFAIGKVQLQGNGTLQATLTDLVQTLSSQFNAVLTKFGAVYVVVGAVTMLALHFTKPKTLESVPVKEDNPEPAKTSATETVVEETEKPTE